MRLLIFTNNICGTLGTIFFIVFMVFILFAGLVWCWAAMDQERGEQLKKLRFKVIRVILGSVKYSLLLVKFEWFFSEFISNTSVKSLKCFKKLEKLSIYTLMYLFLNGHKQITWFLYLKICTDSSRVQEEVYSKTGE
jgi:hypothetical protein